MRVWDALRDGFVEVVAVGTHPQGLAVWVQDAGGRMDIGIWDGEKWMFDSNWPSGAAKHLAGDSAAGFIPITLPVTGRRRKTYHPETG
jgi:hypothetical protein